MPNVRSVNWMGAKLMDGSFGSMSRSPRGVDRRDLAAVVVAVAVGIITPNEATDGNGCGSEYGCVASEDTDCGTLRRLSSSVTLYLERWYLAMLFVALQRDLIVCVLVL